MAVPSVPSNFYLQQANGQAFLSWDLVAGATGYDVERSIDGGVTYASVSTPTINYYLDDTVTIGTQYFYKVAATNGSGTGSYTSGQSVVPTNSGTLSLGQIRLMSQQRADRVNSNFVTVPEWNSYINQSALELYDMLVTSFEDYFLAPALSFTTDGSQSYTLPNGTNYTGAPAFYKLLGVDVGLNSSSNAWVSLKKFDFIARNRFVYPNISSNYLGVFNMQYRVMGSVIEFIPIPASGQPIRLWYIPRLTELLQDTDILDGISGWTEYVIVDAAIKALQKEESDCTLLLAQKQALKTRIEEAAQDRDAGAPDTISPTRTWAEGFGGGGPGFDGNWGGF